MDEIVSTLLKEFAEAHSLENENQDTQFEHFAAYLTLKRHHDRTFDTRSIVVGKGGGDGGVDSIAVIVNGVLVKTPEEIDDLAQRNGFIAANFIFCQAERSEHFEAAKIGNFGHGVMDIFRETPKMPRNKEAKKAADLIRTILKHPHLISPAPNCRLYYVTTGRWMDDQVCKDRIETAERALMESHIFETVTFTPYGARDVINFYRKTKTAVQRTIFFDKQHAIVGEIHGVKQAHIGYLPAKEFLKIIKDDSGDDILGSIFDENVRDWQDFNKVNLEIDKTIKNHGERFVLMNNGITIIAKKAEQSGFNITIEDYQIVNGCQTSHVIFYNRSLDLRDIAIPVRLIITEDDEIKENIITATNQQTALRPEQLYALGEFSRHLEIYFRGQTDEPLYYERRDCQYDRDTKIKRARIVSPQSLIRSYAAIFLDEATRVTRAYQLIRDHVGTKIFVRGHSERAYYLAALAAYRLESMFKGKRLSSEFKSARYHLLMAFQYLVTGQKMPKHHGRGMDQRCDKLFKVLQKESSSDAIFARAAVMVRDAVEKDQQLSFNRDAIRTEPTRVAILKRFQKVGKNDRKR